MTPLEKKFWGLVEKSDGCWIWKGTKIGNKDNPYGFFYFDKKTYRAHRLSWELSNGELPEFKWPDGICVCHKCDTPLCVRPDHLFLGTQQDNVEDREKKGRGNTVAARQTRSKKQRNQKYCKHGHELFGDNVYIKPNGTRDCKSCRRKALEKYHRNKAIRGE